MTLAYYIIYLCAFQYIASKNSNVLHMFFVYTQSLSRNLQMNGQYTSKTLQSSFKFKRFEYSMIYEHMNFIYLFYFLLHKCERYLFFVPYFVH